MPSDQLPKSLASSSHCDAAPTHNCRIAATALKICVQLCKKTFSTASVITGKAQIEHMISASHSRADIRAFMNRTNRKAPTILHVGAIRDHQAAYLRRAFRPLVLTITASDLVQTATMITICAKATRGGGARQPAQNPHRCLLLHASSLGSGFSVSSIRPTTQ
jgi:hypothetical protein